MPVTWRTVLAPNQGSANRLAINAVDNIQGGFAGLADTLKTPQKEEKEAQKLAFEQALRTRIGDQAQQRIDNQEEQFGERTLENRLIAELEHTRAQQLANMEFGFDQKLANTAHTRAQQLAATEQAAEQAKAESLAKIKKEEKIKIAEIKAGGKLGSVSAFATQYGNEIKELGASDEQVNNMLKFGNYLDAKNKEYAPQIAKLLVQNTYGAGKVDREMLSSLWHSGKNTTKEFDAVIAKIFKQNPGLKQLNDEILTGKYKGLTGEDEGASETPVSIDGMRQLNQMRREADEDRIAGGRNPLFNQPR